jgi:LacI family gluconate utilization system Gnt-I transcriptional repressor
VDCVGLGKAAGELLLRVMDGAADGHRPPPETVLIPFQITQRESS